MEFSLRNAAVVAVLVLSACGSSTSSGPEAERAIRDIEAEMAKAASAKDVPRYVSFYATGATSMFPNAPAANGPVAIRALIEPMMMAPGFTLEIMTEKAVASGDLGYTQGTYKSSTIQNGVSVNDQGKYVTVYQKQGDGSWKVVADIFNSDLPTAPAPTNLPAAK